MAETAKGIRYTTKRIWELERQALEAAERMAAQPRGEAGELVAARVIAARPTLKPDQREMVRRLLAGREGIAVVIGEAGTGKKLRHRGRCRRLGAGRLRAASRSADLEGGQRPEC